MRVLLDRFCKHLVIVVLLVVVYVQGETPIEKFVPTGRMIGILVEIFERLPLFPDRLKNCRFLVEV